jgi:hypothetical protein
MGPSGIRYDGYDEIRKDHGRSLAKKGIVRPIFVARTTWVPRSLAREKGSDRQTHFRRTHHMGPSGIRYDGDDGYDEIRKDQGRSLAVRATARLIGELAGVAPVSPELERFRAIRALTR